MRKPRILLCSESSLVKSGYGRITAELLKRLHSTGKYDVAEFASYMQPLDLLQQRDPLGFNLIQQNPWSAFPVEPYDDERPHFQSNLANQFGSWRFEDVCLDFKPDIVIDVRDVWFFSYLFKSPFRPFYNLSILPAVDGAPQLEEWVDLYSQANNVFTYTDWAAKLLGEYGIRNVECNSPGADLNTFRPMGKANIYGGIAGDNDIFIIGTVQRNQKRKLFPDLFEAFAEFISYCREKGNNKLADKTYLYCHTAYPDLGWDIPRLIKDSLVGHKILFTYICKNPQCNTAFPSLFSDARTICPRCQKFDATMPNTKFGVNEETLAGIISTFDLYVGYASLEGLGLPIIEAAGCSVPVAVVNYSGMEDLAKKLKAIPIKVERFTTEVETGRKFALPSNQDFVAQVYKFLELPEAIRKKRGFDARKGAEKYFNYDKFADKWAKHIDTISVLDHSQTWNSPPRLYEPNMAALQQLGNNVSNADFIDIVCHYIMGPHQHTVSNYTRSFWLRQLNWGMQMISPGAHMMHEMTFLGDIAGMPAMQSFTRQNVVDELKSRIDTINLWEKRRCGLDQYVKPRFLVSGTKREKV